MHQEVKEPPRNPDSEELGLDVEDVIDQKDYLSDR
jgi:hypothetical protein